MQTAEASPSRVSVLCLPLLSAETPSENSLQCASNEQSPSSSFQFASRFTVSCCVLRHSVLTICSIIITPQDGLSSTPVENENTPPFPSTIQTTYTDANFYLIVPHFISSHQNERFEESVERAAREGKDMNNTLAIVEKAGNLTIAEEEVLRSKVEDMEEALEKEQANDRAIEDKIKVVATCVGVVRRLLQHNQRDVANVLENLCFTYRVSGIAASTRENVVFALIHARIGSISTSLSVLPSKSGTWFL